MKRIVVVGGGTGGWMAALAIASRFPDKEVTVVDPTVIGPLGVGESVTGVAIAFVNDPLHNLSMKEFVRRCDVTFKTGIWYKDWQDGGTEYLTPIDSPQQYMKHRYDTDTEEFFAWCAAEGYRLGDVQVYAQLMRSCRTDHIRNPDGAVILDHARVSCHFDALKFGAWLKENALTRPNIRHVDDVIEGFELEAESGTLRKIRTRLGREIEGDFFLDCTGFHRSVLGRAYQPRWISYTDYIRVDSAIPFFTAHDAAAPLPSYTLAAAMRHGWRWQIPTQIRMGNGYVYASRYVSDADAVEECRGAGFDPGEQPRILRFQAGRFEKQWIGNVCAIGIAGGFIEPLEATTIHGMYVQIRLFTDLYLPFCTRDSLAVLARHYNRLSEMAYEDYVDFVSFHYVTGRSDTEFWRDCQKPSAITAANQARREKWRYAFPVREDFAPTQTLRVGHLSSLIVWAPMLCGLGLLNRDHARRIVDMSRQPQLLRENVARYFEVRNYIVSCALPHREALQHVGQDFVG